MLTCDQISDCQYFQCDNHFVIRSSSAAMSQPIGVFFCRAVILFSFFKLLNVDNVLCDIFILIKIYCDRFHFTFGIIFNIEIYCGHCHQLQFKDRLGQGPGPEPLLPKFDFKSPTF